MDWILPLVFGTIYAGLALWGIRELSGIRGEMAEMKGDMKVIRESAEMRFEHVEYRQEDHEVRIRELEKARI